MAYDHLPSILKGVISVLEHLTCMAMIVDQDYKIVYCNETFQKDSAIDADKIPFSTWDVVFKNEHLSESSMKEIENMLTQDSPFAQAIHIKTLSNGDYWFEVRGFDVEADEAHQYRVVIAENVTRDVKAEADLRIEKTRLETIFKYAPVGMIFLDGKLAIKGISGVGARIIGSEPDTLIDTNFGEVFQLDTPITTLASKNDTTLRAKLEDIFSGKGSGGDVEIKQNFRTLYGPEEKWFKVSLAKLPLEESIILILLEDITIRKQIANELIASEKRLRLITDNMLDLITQIDANGMVVYATPSHFTILGYQPEELIGKSMLDFIYEDDKAMVRDRLSKRVQMGESYTSEIRIIKYDGSFLWVEATGNVVVDDFLGDCILYVSRDITMRKQAEYETLRAKEQAIEANRSKSQFLANMSHEIRTPLNGIIGMTNLTMMTTITAEQKDNLSMVKNSAITLLNIINDILDFSKLEAGKVSIEKIRFNLPDIVSRVVKPLKMQGLEKHIDVEMKIHEGVPEHVHGDPVRISQVLSNLISNAVKFTIQGGVFIEVKLDHTKPTKGDVSHILFIVQDTGIGISEDDLERIFMSFSQADGSITRKFGGTGLGLSITKMLVDLMGGTLEVNSQINLGTTFSFSIPLKSAQSIMSVGGLEEDIEYVPEISYSLKILICEDEKINQKLFKRLLVKQGHEVAIAENGIQAIDILKENKFDLILMDIQMPMMDGLSTLSVIRNELKLEVPVIAVTAYALKGDRERFMSAGMNEYISKPINIREFYEKIDRVSQKQGKNNADAILDRIIHQNEAPVRLDRATYAMPLYDIKLFIDKNDAEMVEKTCHRLKEMFERDGAMRLKRLAMKMELSARRQNMQEAIVFYSEILKQMEI